jgi:hypothetical protein
MESESGRVGKSLLVTRIGVLLLVKVHIAHVSLSWCWQFTLGFIKYQPFVQNV